MIRAILILTTALILVGCSEKKEEPSAQAAGITLTAPIPSGPMTSTAVANAVQPAPGIHLENKVIVNPPQPPTPVTVTNTVIDYGKLFFHHLNVNEWSIPIDIPEKSFIYFGRLDGGPLQMMFDGEKVFSHSSADIFDTTNNYRNVRFLSTNVNCTVRYRFAPKL